MNNITFIHPSKKPCIAKVMLSSSEEKIIEYVVGMYTSSKNTTYFININNENITSINNSDYKKIVFVPYKKDK